MLPYFNTSGPCIPGDHYMLPPERRLGWLVVFDLRAAVEWDEPLTMREVEHRGKRVHVVGC